MPAIEIIFFRDNRGFVPVLEWLEELRRWDSRGYAKCVAQLRRLAERGYELRRPAADLLRDGIYELRARKGRLNYRILYFFHERDAILAHGLKKEKTISDADLKRAIDRRNLYVKDPSKYGYEEEIEGQD